MCLTKQTNNNINLLKTAIHINNKDICDLLLLYNPNIITHEIINESLTYAKIHDDYNIHKMLVIKKIKNEKLNIIYI